jgi:chromosome segregation ATPase
MEYWPVLETKARTLILDLVEPTVRRTNDHKKLIDQLKIAEDIYSRRLESQETMIERINNRLTILDEYARRLIQFESDLRIFDLKAENEREKIRDAAELLASRVTTNEENIEALNGKAECLRLDIQIVEQNLNSTRTSLSDNLSQHEQEMKAGFESEEEKRKELEISALNTERKVQSLTKEFSELDLLSKNTARLTQDSAEQIESLSESLSKAKKEFKDQTERIRSLTLNYNRQSTESIKKLKDNLSSLQTEQPLQTHSQITEILYSTFTDLPTRKKIAETEFSILPRFENLSIPEVLKAKILEFSERSQALINTEIPKKKKKKFKIADLLTMDNKLKTHEEKMKDLEVKVAYIEGSHEQSKKNLHESSSESESDELANNLQVFKENAEVFAQIIGVKDYGGEIEALKEMIGQCNMTLTDFTSQIIEISQKFTGEINSIHQTTDQLQVEDEKIYNQIDQNRNFIKETYSELEKLSKKEEKDLEFVLVEIKNTREVAAEKIKNIQEILDKFMDDTSKTVQSIDYQVQQAVYECNAASSQRKRDHNDNNNEFSKIHQQAENFTIIQENQLRKLDTMQNVLSKIHEFLKIGIALQYQDEIDREAIALIGYKETKTKTAKPGTAFGRASVSLDKQCISCSGQVNLITSAFKIACLAYTPSLVFYKDSSFTRIELLEFQRKIIEGLPQGHQEEVSVDRTRKSKTPKPHWRPVSSLSMCVPSGLAQTPDLPPISLSKRTNNYMQ